MSQEKILDLMGKNPERWFSIKEVENRIGKKTNVWRKIEQLYKFSFLERKGEGHSQKPFFYRYNQQGVVK